MRKRWNEVKVTAFKPPGSHYNLLPLPPPTTGPSGTWYLVCHPFASITAWTLSGTDFQRVSNCVSGIFSQQRGKPRPTGPSQYRHPRSICKIRVVLCNLALEEYPCMLNWIQVWRVGWMVSNIDIVACKESLHYIRGMDPRIVLLKYRTAKCDINQSAAG